MSTKLTKVYKLKKILDFHIPSSNFFNMPSFSKAVNIIYFFKNLEDYEKKKILKILNLKSQSFKIKKIENLLGKKIIAAYFSSKKTKKYLSLFEKRNKVNFNKIEKKERILIKNLKKTT